MESLKWSFNSYGAYNHPKLLWETFKDVGGWVSKHVDIFCGDLKQKFIISFQGTFPHFSRTISSAQFVFFPTKNMFATVPTNTAVRNNRKLKEKLHTKTDLIIKFIDIMREALIVCIGVSPPPHPPLSCQAPLKFANCPSPPLF